MRSSHGAITCFILLVFGLPAAGAEFRANDYGAKGDGTTTDTAPIQKTIDAAAKSGGTVVFKPGTYISGSLFLKTGVRFRVDDGVVILGSQDQAAYPVMMSRIAGVEMKWPAALINVYEQANVSISGGGIVDGDGKQWWDRYWKMRREDYEPRGIRWAVDYDCPRPRLIQIYKSSNVNLAGLTLKRSGFWTVHICYSNNVTVDGITIRNNGTGAAGDRGPSTDGIDIDSATNVLVEHCDIECNDDAICLKAGRDADGLRVNKPTEKVVIRDNTIRAGAAGVTFGSETSGGIRDVEAYRLHVLPGVTNGILFKSASTRGGTIQDIRVHDMDIEGVNSVFSVQFNWNPAFSYATIPPAITDYPDYWKILATPVPPAQGLPHLRNIAISDIKATGARNAFSVESYKDSPLADVTFQNFDAEARVAGSIRNAENWTFINTHIKAADGSVVAVRDSEKVIGLPVQ
jgi:polygalacturonase